MIDNKSLQSQILAKVGEYRKLGLNIMPIRTDGSKAPKIQWKAWQTERVPHHLLRKHFVDSKHLSGIGIICGVTSGDLEVLDFDDTAIWKPWSKRMSKQLHGVFGYAPLVITPTGGKHLYYRCEAVGPSVELAWQANGDIAIETRGQGGQAVMPGSPPQTHESGILYRLAGGSWSKIPRITPQQRDTLFEITREFDLGPPKKVADPAAIGLVKDAFGWTPWDDFNEQANWEEILTPQGWGDLGLSGGVNYWRRPGKDDPGASASTGFCGDLLHVFSTNAKPFAGGGTYSKFAALAYLYFDGDFSTAARTLAARGYGDRDDTEERLTQIIKGS